MLTFITLIGLAISLIVFLNMLSAKDTVRNLGPKDRKKFDPPGGVDVRRYMENSKDIQGPRPRICPLCGTMLSQEDFLYAALEPEPDGPRKRQARIYGCRYCFETEGVNLHSRELTKVEP